MDPSSAAAVRRTSDTTTYVKIFGTRLVVGMSPVLQLTYNGLTTYTAGACANIIREVS
jgi:hypothetical protein